MRWFWIDRFVEFESGRRATALKAVTNTEEQLEGYLAGFPVMPASLIIEGFAQAGGLLVGERGGFQERIVLAKVSRCRFHFEARPGDVLRYEVTVQDIQPMGAIVHGTSYIGDRVQGEIELVFAHLDSRFAGIDLFHPDGFLCMLRLFGVYDVGRKPDGSPIEVPQHLLDAEAKANGRQPGTAAPSGQS